VCDVRVDAGDDRGQPAAVADRDREVVLAVPELDRDADAADVAAPRGQRRGPVVPPALVALAHAVLDYQAQVLGHVAIMRRILTGGAAPPVQPALGGGQYGVLLLRVGPPP